MAKTATKVAIPEAEVITVSPQQDTALLALLSGKLQQEAAQIAGVTPETVSRWLANDARFVALLNARRRELWELRRGRLQALFDEAIDTLQDCLSSGKPENRLRAAMVILQASGVLEASVPGGPTSPDAVEKQWFLERNQEKLSVTDLMLADMFT